MKTLLKKTNHIRVRSVLVQSTAAVVISINCLRWLGINDHNQVWFLSLIAYTFTCFLVIKDCDRNQMSLHKIVGEFPKENVWIKLIGVNATLYLLVAGFAAVAVGTAFIILPSLADKLYNTEFSSAPVYQADFILQFMALVIIAPPVEEFVFRGIILNRWIEKWGVTKALVASSCLFGLLHPYNVVGISIFGLILGILYLRYQTLWVTFFCHAVHNTVAFSLFNMPKNWIEDVPSESMKDSSPLYSIGWILIGLFISAISLLLLWQVFNLKFPKGYVQPSFKALDVGHSKDNYSTYVSRSILGFLTVLISGLLVVRNDVYRSASASEPYRSLTSKSKDMIDDSEYKLEKLIYDDKSDVIKRGDAIYLLSIISFTYEEGSKSMKDLNAVKLAVKKSQGIEEIKKRISSNEVVVNSSILKEVKRKAFK